MNGEYVLDSNIIIDIFRGKQTAINQLVLNKAYVPSIVLGELYFGANKSEKTEERIRQIKQFEQSVTILSVNDTTAEIYGEIKNKLKQMGKPIPENDIWIAAVAKEVGLPLITRDKHFANIGDIAIVNPDKE